jgi:hypothetical protein
MKKCIVITTINKPTPAIIKYSNMTCYDLIIVADRKTPIDEYKDVKCILLTMEKQKELFPKFCELLKKDHYCRKNIGYLYAIKNNYDILFDTDDDNLPYERFDNILTNHFEKYEVSCQNKFLNVYKFYTNEHIWPRGFPLKHVNKTENYLMGESDESNISIIQGLVDGDPDVDAIFRLTSSTFNKDFKFEKNNKMIILNENTYCPANTQNTFWLNKDIFYLLYIPSHVSFRFCDILKMYVAQKLINMGGEKISFIEPYVYQERNDHDLLLDFASEYEMHMNVETLINLFDQIQTGNKYDVLIEIYQKAYEYGIIKNKDEIDLIEEWIRIIKD